MMQSAKIKIFGWIQLLLMLFYIGNTTLFVHSHTIDGQSVIHSHFFSGSASSHTHSTSALDFIQRISHPDMLNSEQLQCCDTIIETTSLRKTVNISYISGEHILYSSLRAPPAVA